MKLSVVSAISFLVCGCSLFVARGLTQEDRLLLKHADALKRETKNGRVKQILQGNVKLQQGKTVIECDLATQFINEDPIALIGHVSIVDENKALYADTVYFYQETSVQIAVGHVKSITESDTTFADRITYYEKENKIVSQGHVRIVNVKERTILSGGLTEYLRGQKYGKILQEPVWTKMDSLGRVTMTIAGDSMEVFDGGNRMVALGKVKIKQQETRATCERAEYFKQKEETILTHNPIVIRDNQHISGDTLKLYLKNSQLMRAEVIGNALATSDADTLSPGRWVNRLAGDRMDFIFSEKKLQTVLIENQAVSKYHNIENQEYKGVNEVSGDKIEINFYKGEVSRIRVSSNPEFANGKYSPPKK